MVWYKNEDYRDAYLQACKLYNKGAYPPKRQIRVVEFSINKENEIFLSLNLGNNSRFITFYDLNGKIKTTGTIRDCYSGIVTDKQLNFFNESIGLYKKCIKIDPKNADPYRCIGRVCQFLRMYDEAIDYYEKAIKLEPKQIQGHYLLDKIKECKEAKERGFIVTKLYS